ncbi:hypothetical protein [Pseudomonas soli]|uniref:hypothetical protein n=1 Tax=Pseudomonas soli TaxID=1306993 RepID=UPI00299D1849|nr:hypothetical protein [Pseudomonas soli]MDW9402615.1 hypothetical protein [Pseudomonas soli]
MQKPTAISRRVEQSALSAQNNDFEASLLHLFPAIDKTAQLRYPKDKVGPRFKKFLHDQHDIVSLIAFNNVINITHSGMTFPDAIYKLARNPLIHESELDKRITFNNECGLEISENHWNLPKSYILGLCIAVVVAPENRREWINHSLSCRLWGCEYRINQLWARPDLIYDALRQQTSLQR